MKTTGLPGGCLCTVKVAGKVVVTVVAAALRLLRAASGNKRPISRETGSAWAPHFLFMEFVPGESEREGWSGAV